MAKHITHAEKDLEMAAMRQELAELRAKLAANEPEPEPEPEHETPEREAPAQEPKENKFLAHVGGISERFGYQRSPRRIAALAFAQEASGLGKGHSLKACVATGKVTNAQILAHVADLSGAKPSA